MPRYACALYLSTGVLRPASSAIAAIAAIAADALLCGAHTFPMQPPPIVLFFALPCFLRSVQRSNVPGESMSSRHSHARCFQKRPRIRFIVLGIATRKAVLTLLMSPFPYFLLFFQSKIARDQASYDQWCQIHIYLFQENALQLRWTEPPTMYNLSLYSSTFRFRYAGYRRMALPRSRLVSHIQLSRYDKRIMDFF